MTPQQFIAEVERRIRISEGCELRAYTDSVGVRTVGIGCNIDTPGAPALLARVGATDFAAVHNGALALTQQQVDQLFDIQFTPIAQAARLSLAPGIYDTLSDARRFVICDLEFNLGQAGWLGFPTTRGLINEAQTAKNDGNLVKAHALFGFAADHLTASAWFGQVHDRARRNVAMIRTGEWVNATGNGAQ